MGLLIVDGPWDAPEERQADSMEDGNLCRCPPSRYGIKYGTQEWSFQRCFPGSTKSRSSRMVNSAVVDPPNQETLRHTNAASIELL